MVRREAGAWEVAKRLGWNDLVSATVVRFLDSLAGAYVAHSIQVLWPANEPGVPENQFSERDRWRAAIFDAVIRATDRHPANWLGVPRNPVGGIQRLKLIDHGHAFDLARPLLTPFYTQLRGEEIPPGYLVAIENLASKVDGIERLLDSNEFDAFRSRVERLRQGTLEIGEP